MDGIAESLKTSPAHIFVGKHKVVGKIVLQQLQSFFCLQKGCGQCHTCLQLFARQHHAVRWIVPDKQYKVEQIHEIITESSYLLAENQHYFFVLEKAELLTHSCANRLLKILEEPSVGYHFILQVEHENALLSTIRSRCLITRCEHAQNEIVQKELLDQFTTFEKVLSPADFLKYIERSVPDEYATKIIYEAIVLYWVEQKKKAQIDNKEKDIYKADVMLSFFKNQNTCLPAIGGAKLFWLKIYAQVKALFA